ncbi:hypothetical protein BT93_E2190 [Corymbia citriodora subsp. variegata]|nr:hypothetical protein BT93_E2190 [Corymbia citriodora subsp. variegata]
MATPRLLFLATLFVLASITVEARDFKERESFSKFTNANDNDDTEKTQVVPQKEESLTPVEALRKQENQEQQPTFLPQTQNGYGLYGHEEEKTVRHTPSAATATGNRPSRTAMPDDSFYSYPNSNFENGNSYYNKDAYVADQREQARNTYVSEEQNFGGNTRLQDSSYTTTTTGGAGGYRATNDHNNYYTGGNRYSAAQREGMSDTRYMAKGRYYYDVDNEEKYFQNRYARSKPEYSTQGYYVNGDGSGNPNDNVNLYEQQFNNVRGNSNGNVNLYDQQFNNVRDNSMRGYQDQEEFQESQDNEFVP